MTESNVSGCASVGPGNDAVDETENSRKTDGGGMEPSCSCSTTEPTRTDGRSLTSTVLSLRILTQEQISHVEVRKGEVGIKSELREQLKVADTELNQIDGKMVKFSEHMETLKGALVAMQQEAILESQEDDEIQDAIVRLGRLINYLSTPISDLLGRDLTDDDYQNLLEDFENRLEEALLIRQDFRDMLDEITGLIIARLQVFIYTEIEKLSVPKANIKAIKCKLQQFKYYFHFIEKHNQSIAMKIRQEYIIAMDSLYLKHFTKFVCEYEENLTANDLIGLGENTTSIFKLNNRNELLTSDGPQENFKYFEQMFKSHVQTFIDLFSHEYQYFKELFLLEDEEASDMFIKIISSSLKLLQVKLDEAIGRCYDTIGLMLSYQMVQQFNKLCRERSIIVLDGFLRQLDANLKKQFTLIMRQNIDSIQEVNADTFSGDFGVHIVVKRFADYISALLTIKKGSDVTSLKLYNELVKSIDIFLTRFAKGFSGHKKKFVFFINNYDSILSKIDDEENVAAEFRSKLSSRINQYTCEMLRCYFGDVIKYVEKFEYYMEKTAVDQIQSLSARAETEAKNFNEKYQTAIADLKRDLLVSFTNLCTGKQILKLVLTKLIQYYKRLYLILSHPAKMLLVDIETLMSEIKRQETISN
ncbi:vacuolar protein sorting-associated protein 52 homolog [Aethina tumida]|uniref:vacuolar protein sorting-associated protein 52 homolog n=1 Tax=Aethina tumida TaxID=116153 RepID=UPI00096B2B1D|nr:vacuolar protein sorting-associated protein 52 homolog [Aethina tumida]